MRHGMSKPRGLKVRRYTARLIKPNDYLDVFPGANISDRIFLTELNEILLNGMPNSWIKQAYVQVFDCESITFKNMLICLIAWKLQNLFTKV